MSSPADGNGVLPLSWQLRQVRERLCLSQEDLAARTGLSVRTIRNIESGRVAVPRPASLRLLRGIIDEAAVIPRWACPSTLPADVADFCGRRDEFTEVADHLRSARTGMPVVAIHGRPGVGKTALLVHLGHRLRREFPDGQLYLHLGGHSRPVPAFTALDRLLRVLLGDGYVVPAELAARAERFRQLVADRRLLLLFDDVQCAGQIRDLMPGSAGCSVVATSQQELADLPGARHIGLDGLDPADSIELLEHIVGPDRVRREGQAAAEIASCCDHLPLAVRIAGARLAQRPHRSLASMVRLLNDTKSRLDVLEVGGLGVRATVKSAYDALDGPSQAALRSLAEARLPDYPLWSARPLLGEPAAAAEEILDRLVAASLMRVSCVDAAGQARYQIHDFVADYAAEKAANEQNAAARHKARVRRLTTVAWRLCAQATMPLEDSGAYGDRPAWPAEPAPEPSPHAAGLDWLAAESTNLVVVVEQACDHGLVEEAWGLARALHPYYDTGRRDDELTQTSTALRTAAGRAGHAAAEACALIGLAGAAANRGDLEDCYGLHAIASELSDRSGLTRSMIVSSHQMASVLRLSGRLAEAGRVSQESTRQASALGDRDLIIACACESSPVAVASGDPASALRLLCTAAGGLASLPATRRSAIVALRFAQAHRALGEIDAAREYLDFALDLVKVLGDKVGQGYIKLELGHLAHAAGALALAEARFREARLALAAADRPTGEAKALGALARVQTQRGLPGTASRTLHEALAAIEGIQAGNLVTELHRDLLLLTL